MSPVSHASESTTFLRQDMLQNADHNAQGNFVEAQLLLMVETPLAIISVCMPSIFHLFKRAFYHGMPSLFCREDPSKPLFGKLEEHMEGPGNPVDGGVRRFEL